MKYGFDEKQLGFESYKRLGVLIGYLSAAGLKPSVSIKTEEDLWKAIESVYKIKTDKSLPVGDRILVAVYEIKCLSKTKRRRLQRDFKTAPVRASRKKIMDKLSAENEEFYAKLSEPKKERHPSKAQKDEFYKTWDWQKLRIKTFEKYGRRCMCCGATNESIDMTGRPVQIVVDHVKPLHNYWSMRLNENNTQILCFDCNMGKGIDETDYRPKPAPDEWIIEDEPSALIADQLKIRH